MNDDRSCINCNISLPLDAYSAPHSACCKQCGIDLRRELEARRATR